VALAVTAIVLTMIYGMAGKMSGAKKELEQEAEGYHQARMLFDRMSREIRSIYFPAGARDAIFRGGKDEYGHFFLELTTSVVSPTLPKSSGQAQVRYELQDDPSNSSGLLSLVRDEKSLLPGGEAGGMEYRLSSGINAFRLRFFDGSNWVEEWDAAARGNLPQFVEVYIEIEIGNKRLPFMTAVEIPQS
jgi:general secretion pathway protein J